MARPPVEWPIPAYVTELRERVVATYRVPARALAPLVPAPVAPELVNGQGLVSLCLGNGRCLKPVGGPASLASEFHLAEVVTPARWQGACRPALRGALLLRLLTDSHGLARLVRTALGFETDLALHTQGAERNAYAASLRTQTDREESARLSLARPVEDASWPADSVFPSHEAAEAHLLHPECYFVPSSDGRVVNAAPVHQYARSATHVRPAALAAPLLGDLLRCRPEEVVLDHVLFQRRCTHTWAFPPERIPVARQTPAWSLGRATSRQPVALAA